MNANFYHKEKKGREREERERGTKFLSFIHIFPLFFTSKTNSLRIILLKILNFSPSLSLSLSSSHSQSLSHSMSRNSVCQVKCDLFKFDAMMCSEMMMLML